MLVETRDLLIQYEFYDAPAEGEIVKIMQEYLAVRSKTLMETKDHVKAREAAIETYLRMCEDFNIEDVCAMKGLITSHTVWKYITETPGVIISETMENIMNTRPRKDFVKDHLTKEK